MWDIPVFYLADDNVPQLCQQLAAHGHGSLSQLG
jgi:hypothetical protein